MKEFTEQVLDMLKGMIQQTREERVYAGICKPNHTHTTCKPCLEEEMDMQYQLGGADYCIKVLEAIDQLRIKAREEIPYTQLTAYGKALDDVTAKIFGDEE